MRFEIRYFFLEVGLSPKDKLSLAVYTDADVVVLNDRSTPDPGVFVDEAKDCVDGVG